MAAHPDRARECQARSRRSTMPRGQLNHSPLSEFASLPFDLNLCRGSHPLMTLAGIHTQHLTRRAVRYWAMYCQSRADITRAVYSAAFREGENLLGLSDASFKFDTLLTTVEQAVPDHIVHGIDRRHFGAGSPADPACPNSRVRQGPWL